MKSILILLGTVMLSTTAFAQKVSESKVPTAVLTNFKTKFPSAMKATWEMENMSLYEADFMMDGKKSSAKFEKSGKWKETETEIKIAELPKAVSQTIAKEFAGFKIEEAEKAETSKNGIVYEVKVKKGKETYDVMVASSGKTLEKVTEKDGNEKD
jgi:putative PepSY-like beta-lactamase-inhibitor